jgi:nucleotide-binding universal stress UspA family protein
MFKRVLLCHDGSTAALRALQRGAELAILLNAQVHVLSIAPSGFSNPEVGAWAAGTTCLTPDDSKQRLQESLAWLGSRGVSARGYLAAGNSVDLIVEHAKRLAIDLIVLGHYPQPSGGFWWTNSQRGSLAERARCCVLVAVNTSEGLA